MRINLRSRMDLLYICTDIKGNPIYVCIYERHQKHNENKKKQKKEEKQPEDQGEIETR